MSQPYLIVVIDPTAGGTATGGAGYVADPPETLDAAGTKGQYSYSADGNTRYDCIDTNTWRASDLTIF